MSCHHSQRPLRDPTMSTPSVVAYYRVSTAKQGSSGLGLEAQRDAVSRYAASINAHIVQEYTEIESGRKSDRPELARAIKASKRLRATLVVAKLDRLSRNVAFLATLIESGAQFVACDNPSANTLTLHVLAAVAEQEAKAISERTKAALAAYKARGGTLGGSRSNSAIHRPEVAQKGRQAGSRANREKAKTEYSDVLPIVIECRNGGMTLAETAKTLGNQGFTTVNGAEFTPTTVRRILNRQF